MSKLIMSDVDGTLVKGSIMLKHAGYLLEKGIIEDNGIYEAWREDVKNESLIAALAEHYRFSILNRKLEDLEPSKFLADFLTNDSNLYSTFKYLEDEHKNGATVHLISGSPDYLIERLASLYGYNWTASQYKIHKRNHTFTGTVRGMYSRDQKAKYVKTNLNLENYDEVVALGDTCSDEGLFMYADTKILVDPTKQTLENIMKVDKIIYV